MTSPSPTTGHREFILAGTGGQGLILAGILLAEAAILDGRNVVQTQSYGIASRGGLSLAEVIIDDDEIIFQQVRKPDCVLALSEEAATKYETWAAKGVMLLYDSALVQARTGPNFRGHGFTQAAGDMGHSDSANIVALGALAACTRAVSMRSLEQTIAERFRAPARERNLRLLAICGDLAASL
jgi:2-oxoglutarate ferredoxin oxidoreductase subunit gamma